MIILRRVSSKNLSKNECGSMFTYKIEGLFREMKNSEGIMEHFYDRCSGLKKKVKLTVNVFRTSFWPFPPDASVVRPKELSCVTQSFSTFYVSSNEHRKLYIQTNIETSELKANYSDKRYKLYVTNLLGIEYFLYGFCYLFWER